MIDPLAVRCPKDRCHAPRGERCLRLGGYGVPGARLRVAHRERFAEAHRQARHRDRPRWKPVDPAG